MSSPFENMSLEQLRAERDRVNTMIAILMGEAQVAEAVTKRKSNKNKGKPTVWGDFSKSIQKDHKQQIIDYKAAHPDEKSPHLAYVTNYRKQHPEIYDAFKVTWKEAHPDTADTGSVAEEVDAAGGGGSASDVAKPKRVISEEQKAKMKAGREKKKAEKDAAKAGLAVTEPAAVVAAAPVVAAVVTAAPVVAAVVAAAPLVAAAAKAPKEKKPKA